MHTNPTALLMLVEARRSADLHPRPAAPRRPARRLRPSLRLAAALRIVSGHKSVPAHAP